MILEEVYPGNKQQGKENISHQQPGVHGFAHAHRGDDQCRQTGWQDSFPGTCVAQQGIPGVRADQPGQDRKNHDVQQRTGYILPGAQLAERSPQHPEHPLQPLQPGQFSRLEQSQKPGNDKQTIQQDQQSAGAG